MKKILSPAARRLITGEVVEYIEYTVRDYGNGRRHRVVSPSYRDGADMRVIDGERHWITVDGRELVEAIQAESETAAISFVALKEHGEWVGEWSDEQMLAATRSHLAKRRQRR